MANQVKFTLAIDGGAVVVTTLDGVSHSFDAMGNRAKRAGEDASQGIDAVTDRLDKAQATLANYAKGFAAAFVTGKVLDVARETAMLNARYEELAVVQQVIGKNAGYNAVEMQNYASQVQRAGISMIESRNTVIQLAQAQIDLSHASGLARVAQDAAVIGNMNSSQALSTMIHGIKTAQTDVLRTIGINVSFEDSYKAMAKTLGVSTSALSEHQKMLARESAVMAEGEKITGAYEAAMGTAGKQVRSMQRYTEDLKVIQGEVFNEALTIAVMGYTDHLKKANHETATLAANGSLKSWGEGVSNVLAFAADSAMSVVSVLQTVGATTVWLGATSANMAERMKHPFSSTSEDQDTINEAYKQMLDDIWKNVAGMRNALDSRRAALKDDADKRVAVEQDYSRRSLEVMKAYAGQSLQVQQAAQSALARNMFPQGFPDAPKPDKSGTEEHKLTEYQRLTKSIREKTEADLFDIQTQGQLTAGQKDALKIMTDLRDGTLRLTQDEKIKLTQDLEKRLRAEQLLGIENALTKQTQADAAARAAARNKEYEGINAYMLAQQEADNKAVQSSRDALKAAQAQYDQYGMTKSQVAELTLLELRRQQAGLNGDAVRFQRLQEQIDLQERLIGVLRNTQGLDAQKDMWVSIEGAAHTTFNNVLQGGNDMWTRLRESMKSGFFDWLYQMTLKRWIFNASASFSGAGVANAAMPGMGGNALSTASNLGSLYSAGSQLVTGATAGGLWRVTGLRQYGRCGGR